MPKRKQADTNQPVRLRASEAALRQIRDAPQDNCRIHVNTTYAKVPDNLRAYTNGHALWCSACLEDVKARHEAAERAERAAQREARELERQARRGELDAARKEAVEAEAELTIAAGAFFAAEASIASRAKERASKRERAAEQVQEGQRMVRLREEELRKARQRLQEARHALASRREEREAIEARLEAEEDPSLSYGALRAAWNRADAAWNAPPVTKSYKGKHADRRLHKRVRRALQNEPPPVEEPPADPPGYELELEGEAAEALTSPLTDADPA